MAQGVTETPSVRASQEAITRANVTTVGREMASSVDGIQIWMGGRIMICPAPTGSAERYNARSSDFHFNLFQTT